MTLTTCVISISMKNGIKYKYMFSFPQTKITPQWLTSQLSGLCTIRVWRYARYRMSWCLQGLRSFDDGGDFNWLLLQCSGACCNVRYAPETHLKIKSREISFNHNLLLIWQIVSKFCTEHGSVTAVFCAKFQNDLTTDMDVMGERDFARFEFKMSFVWIFYNVTTPLATNLLHHQQTKTRRISLSCAHRKIHWVQKYTCSTIATLLLTVENIVFNNIPFLLSINDDELMQCHESLRDILGYLE